MSAFITSASLIALSEIGDKTQLLSIMLAACYRKPFRIMLAILLATALNHAIAAYAGHLLGNQIHMHLLMIVISLSSIGFGLWVLVPDVLENMQCTPNHNVFIGSFVAFFVAEIGDKTQLVTLALGARYPDVLAVIAGTTCGMMIANIPAVLVGERLLKLIPLKWVRYAASALFIGLGVSGLLALLR